MSGKNIIHLYRSILREGRTFPSMNKDRIVHEIKQAFHKNKTMKEGKKLDEAISVAIRGLSQMKQYNNLQRNQKDWEIHLEKNPMPKPDPREKY